MVAGTVAPQPASALGIQMVNTQRKAGHVPILGNCQEPKKN